MIQILSLFAFSISGAAAPNFNDFPCKKEVHQYLPKENLQWTRIVDPTPDSKAYRARASSGEWYDLEDRE